MTIFLISEAYNHSSLSIHTPNSALDIMALPGNYDSENVAQGDATPRRRGMTIQDMLNPSDEEVRQSSRRPTRSLSSSPEIAQKTRVFRPAYSTEEQHFIWYLRIDRGYLWPDLLDAFNARFARPGGGRELSGLQCRYYRLLGQYGIPNVTRRDAEVVQKYGMKATLERAGCSVTYPWLGDQYVHNPYSQVLDVRSQHPAR